MKGEIAYLVGKDVRVMAHGIEYRGRLIEIGADEVYLKGVTGWITLVTSDIEEIKELTGSPGDT
jgi:hypothetical protein